MDTGDNNNTFSGYPYPVGDSGSIISGGYSCSIESSGVIGIDLIDNFFMLESIKSNVSILKYSPIDSEWKIYENGEVKKEKYFSFKNCDAETKLFEVEGKIIGCLIIN